MGLTAPRPEPDLDAACDAERAAEVFAALASPWRLEIVRLLATGPLEVTEIANQLGISVANTSHHLARLRFAGLVTSRRDGTRITNTLAGPHVLALCLAACEAVPTTEARGLRR
jgi:DNA-binding transcriptional ArsR family regulator